MKESKNANHKKYYARSDPNLSYSKYGFGAGKVPPVNGIRSCPKRWLEEVFTFGFAHDAEGGKLNGKKLILSMTSGAPESQYHIGEKMNFPMEVYQLPLLQLAKLCGMDFSGMVYTGGYVLLRKNIDKELYIQMAKDHAEILIGKIRETMNLF